MVDFISSRRALSSSTLSDSKLFCSVNSCKEASTEDVKLDVIFYIIECLQMRHKGFHVIIDEHILGISIHDGIIRTSLAAGKPRRPTYSRGYYLNQERDLGGEEVKARGFCALSATQGNSGAGV